MSSMLRKPQLRVLLPAMLLILTACWSDRYWDYRKSVRKLKVGEMNEDEFRKRFYVFHTPEEYDISDTTLPIKFKGCYVFKDDIGRYGVYKFLPNGTVLSTWRMNGYPDNLTLLTVGSMSYYYRLKGNVMMIEYLVVTRDKSVYNMLMTGIVRNDTIILNHVQEIRPRKGVIQKMDEICVYDSTLTTRP